MKDSDKPARKSVAVSGEGTDDPERVAQYDVNEDTDSNGSAIMWFGNEYDGGACWMWAEEGDFADIEEMR
jgi:hypothetical protein